jgi:hypothetical protein
MFLQTQMQSITLTGYYKKTVMETMIRVTIESLFDDRADPGPGRRPDDSSADYRANNGMGI